MDEIVTRLEVLLPRLEKLVEDHEQRIRALEKRSLRLAGAIGLALVLVPILLSLF